MSLQIDGVLQTGWGCSPDNSLPAPWPWTSRHPELWRLKVVVSATQSMVYSLQQPNGLGTVSHIWPTGHNLPTPLVGECEWQGRTINRFCGALSIRMADAQWKNNDSINSSLSIHRQSAYRPPQGVKAGNQDSGNKKKVLIWNSESVIQGNEKETRGQNVFRCFYKGSLGGAAIQSEADRVGEGLRLHSATPEDTLCGKMSSTLIREVFRPSQFTNFAFSVLKSVLPQRENEDQATWAWNFIL